MDEIKFIPTFPCYVLVFPPFEHVDQLGNPVIHGKNNYIARQTETPCGKSIVVYSERIDAETCAMDAVKFGYGNPRIIDIVDQKAISFLLVDFKEKRGTEIDMVFDSSDTFLGWLVPFQNVLNPKTDHG